MLLRPGGDVEIGFDAAVLVALGVLLPHSQALVLWSIAGILSQVVSSKRLWARMFNVGLVILVGGLALAAMSAVGGLGPHERPRVRRGTGRRGDLLHGRLAHHRAFTGPGKR